jgi:hypothetical protein
LLHDFAAEAAQHHPLRVRRGVALPRENYFG